MFTGGLILNRRNSGLKSLAPEDMGINSLSIQNQLFRVAELALRNEERLCAWRFRYEEFQAQQQIVDAAKKEKENVSKTNT